MNSGAWKCTALDMVGGQGWGRRRTLRVSTTIIMALMLLMSNRLSARVVRRQCMHPDGIKVQLLEVIKQFDEDTGKGAQHLQAMAERCLRIGWQRRAQMGCPYGQVLLGLCRENGAGIEQDHKVAVDWYQKTLPEEDGTEPFRPLDEQINVVHAFACYRLGEAYRLGNGVEQDEKQAIHWLRKAAEQGDKQAEIRLQEMGHSFEVTK